MKITDRIKAAYQAWKAIPPFSGSGGAGLWSDWSWGSLYPNTRINYAAEIGPLTGSSLIMAAVNFTGTALPEAPVQVMRRNAQGDYEPVRDHPMIALLDRPNPYYSGELLLKAFGLSWLIDGNAYFLKNRNAMGTPIELWYEPHFSIRPRWPANGSEFISYYEVLRDGGWYRVETKDVIQCRYGIDPYNIRCGLSPVASVLREIFTDSERARYSALILKNGGVVPFLMTPKEGGTLIDPKEIKREWEYRTTGDNLGKPMVLSNPVEVQEIGQTPDKLLVEKASMIPEARLAAVTGIPSAVLGFTSGMQQTKVGAPQPLCARLWTPTGPTIMGDVQPGDVIATPHGWETINHVYPQGEQDIYRITFQDGSMAESTLDHLWTVHSPNDSDYVTLPLSAIAEFPWWKLKRTTLPLQGVVEFEAQETLIPPYLFGLLLADGSFRRNIFFSNIADEIVDRAMRSVPVGYTVKNIQHGDYLISYADAARGRGIGNGTGALNPMKDELRRLGLWMLYSHEKFIPDLYKYNSSHSRRELLRGLLDGDGFVNHHGQPALEQTSSRLSKDVTWIVQSLGGYTLETLKRVDRRTRMMAGRPMQSNHDRYHLSIVIDDASSLFTYSAKQDRCRPRIKPATRKFRAIELVRKEEAKCIEIEGGHYLTDHFLVTHNTMKELREQAYESFIIPTQRLLAAELRVQLLPDFPMEDGDRVEFDLSKVRVLQDDQNALMDRYALGYEKGIVTRGEARAALGLEVIPEDDVYFVEPAPAFPENNLPNVIDGEPPPDTAGQNKAQSNGAAGTDEEAVDWWKRHAPSSVHDWIEPEQIA